MTPLDPDRRLALSYVPAARRAALDALWRLDAALGAVLAGGKDRMIARIRLAWWRESLERLDAEPAPAEPVLRSVAEHLLPAISGAELARMETGWSVLLGDDPLTGEELDIYAAKRGGSLFGFSARLLGGASDVEPAGEAWALADLARRSGQPDAGSALAAAAARSLPGRWPPPLRPLGMLAMLARRDIARGLDALEPPGSPARMLLMLRHRLTGF